MKKPLKRVLTAAALLAAPALINNAIFARAKALGNPLGGEGRFWSWRDGDVFYARQGQGNPPAVLLHGMYAGASLYEWRKNFDALGEHYDVCALDWLGFGLSDKPHIRYSASLYIDLLRDFLREVVGRPCTLIASSLAAAYAVEAALALPELVQSLVLVCPAGLHNLSRSQTGFAQDAKYTAISSPFFGVSLYNVITSRASLRAYLQNQVYFDPSYVTDEMIDHYSTAAHQYGAQYAPLSFVSGELNHSVADSLPRLTQDNIRIVWGREAKMTTLSDAEAYLAANPRAEMTIFDKAGLLPHDEQASAFNRLITEIVTDSSVDNTKAIHGGKSKKQE